MGFMELLLWIGWRILMAWGSGAIARRKGYAGWPYVLLGALLGLAGLFLTLVATRAPRQSPKERAELERLALQRVVAGGGDGSHPLLAGLDGGSAFWSRVLELIRWDRKADTAHSRLLVLTVGLFGVGLEGLLWTTTWILPTFVQLFEGMNLELDLPTQLLMGLAKTLRSPLGLLLLPVLSLIPAGLYLLLSRLPAWVELQRRTDLAWLLQALSVADAAGASPATALALLPEGVRQRVAPPGAGVTDPLRRLDPGSADLLESAPDRSAALEELRLQAASHAEAGVTSAATIGVSVGILLGLFLMGYAIVAVFLPLYPLIGNLG